MPSVACTKSWQNSLRAGRASALYHASSKFLCT
jgi:hypothetical protein